MIEAKLLNCPFCKEELEVVGKGHYFAHKTNGCILQHLCFEIDDEEAIKAWNTRKPMERIIERLEEESVLTEKEMDRAREQNPLQYERCDSYICAIDNAIEIVKEDGGIK